jgi:hypothetical protein
LVSWLDVAPIFSSQLSWTVFLATTGLYGAVDVNAVLLFRRPASEPL